jgi:hypothetical protein
MEERICRRCASPKTSTGPGTRDPRCQSTRRRNSGYTGALDGSAECCTICLKELAHLVLRPRSPAAPGRLWCSPLSPFFVPLLSRPPLPTPWLLRSPGIGVGSGRAGCAGCFRSCATCSIDLGINRFVRHQAVLGIDDFAFPIHSEAFRERFSAPALRFARLEIDGFARELAFGLRRWRRKRNFRGGMGPYRLDHRLKDRNRDVAAGRTAAERAALAVGVVVAQAGVE